MVPRRPHVCDWGGLGKVATMGYSFHGSDGLFGCCLCGTGLPHLWRRAKSGRSMPETGQTWPAMPAGLQQLPDTRGERRLCDTQYCRAVHYTPDPQLTLRLPLRQHSGVLALRTSPGVDARVIPVSGRPRGRRSGCTQTASQPHIDLRSSLWRQQSTRA